MRSRHAAFAIVFGALLTACQPDAPVPVALASRSGLGLDLQVEASAASLSMRSAECGRFTGTARMNGQPLVQTETGDPFQALTIYGYMATVCFPPTWEVPLPLPDEPSTTFEVLDDTGRLVLTVKALTAPRTLALAPGQSSTVRWGETLRFEWSPASDSFRTAGSFQLRWEGQARAGSIGYNAGTDGRYLTLELPSAPEEGPAQGQAELIFNASRINVGIERCEPNPDACEAILIKEGPPPGSSGGPVGYVATFTFPLTFE